MAEPESPDVRPGPVAALWKRLAKAGGTPRNFAIVGEAWFNLQAIAYAEWGVSDDTEEPGLIVHFLVAAPDDDRGGYKLVSEFFPGAFGEELARALDRASGFRPRY